MTIYKHFYDAKENLLPYNFCIVLFQNMVDKDLSKYFKILPGVHEEES